MQGAPGRRAVSATDFMIVLTPFLVLLGTIYSARDRHVKMAALDAKADEIHVLVNNRMTEALERIAALEAKLGLASGEPIPGPRLVTETSEPHPEGDY